VTADGDAPGGPAVTAVRERRPVAVWLSALVAIPAGVLGVLVPLPVAAGAFALLSGLAGHLPAREVLSGVASALSWVLGPGIAVLQVVGAGLLLARRGRRVLLGAGLAGLLGVGWSLGLVVEERDAGWLLLAGLTSVPVAAALLSLAPSVGPWLARVPGSGRPARVRPPSRVRRFLRWLYLE
jgi:hypothetical protein